MTIDPLLERLWAEPVDRFTLDNGLTVLFKEDRRAEVCSAQVWVKTGSIHEGDRLGVGLSHYLEHMLFKGTQQRTFKQITGDLQAVGAGINAYTTFDRTVYYVDGPAEGFEIALDVLADMVFASEIDPEETAREKAVILREIDMYLDNPDDRVMQALFKTAYRQFPYRYPVIGERALFEAVSRETVVDYYRARYVPNNMVLCLVGALDADAIRPVIEQAFGKAPMCPLANPYVPSEPRQCGRRVTRLEGDFQVARGAMAYKLPGLGHPDAAGLTVLGSILGQGYSSILWQRLREEKQLVHEVDASSWSPGDEGLLWISYVCDKGKHEAVEAAVREELAKLTKEMLDSAWIDQVVRQAVVNEVDRRKTVSGVASRLGVYEVVVGDLAYPAYYFGRLQEVDGEYLRHLAQSYFLEDQASYVSLSAPSKRSVPRVSATVGAVPDVEEVVLPNGVRILLQPVGGLPKVHIKTASLGGAVYESSSHRGATSLLATLLTKDTEKHSAAEVARRVESVGGTMQEYAGNNSFGLGLEVMSQDVSLALDVLEEAVLKPTFVPEMFSLEKEVQLAQIRDTQDDVMGYGRMLLREKFFGKHPFCIDTLGTLETVERLSVEDLQGLYAQLIVGSNFVISVSGDFDRDDLLAQLTECFSVIPKKDFHQSGDPWAGYHSPGMYEEIMDREQTVVYSAFPGVGITDDLYYTSEVLDEFLSGMSSRLFERVRERLGMAYYVGSNHLVGVDAGMFYLYAGTALEHYPRVLDEFEKELSRVRELKITEEEVEPCRVRLKAQKRMSLQTAGARAMGAALNALYSLPLNAWRGYPQQVDAVSPESMAKFVSGFTRDQGVHLVVRPEA